MKKVLCFLWVCFACAFPLTGCGRGTEISYERAVTSEDVWSVEKSRAPVYDASETKAIYVSVMGDVKEPGVYIMPEGSRVYEALNAAGGIVPPGDINGVDLVNVLKDGARVYVPGAASQNGEKTGTGEAGAININLASESDLTKIPGIGPAKAKTIVSYREKNGPFSSIEDIMNISGIKEGTFEKIKDYITVY